MARETFISEPIAVDVASMSSLELARGAPSCPRRFSWRDELYTVVDLLETTRKVNDEGYVTCHSFRVRTDPPWEMVLRCDRDLRGGNPWRVFTARRLKP